MSLLLMEDDEATLLESLRAVLPLEVQVPGNRPMAGSCQLSLGVGSGMSAHFIRPSMQAADYVSMGARVLIAGQMALPTATDAARRPVASAFWRAVRRASVGDLWQLNPVGNHWKGAAPNVRAGAAALRFWRAGGLLGSPNAHVFYGPGPVSE